MKPEDIRLDGSEDILLDASAGVVHIGSLCTGYGGLDMAVQAVFGGNLAWWSDIEPGPIKVMQHHHPDVPNLGDLKTVDWSSVQPIEVLTAGYPCQPFSNAGKRLGTEDPRHLWPWISDAIGLLRPRIVVLENVAAHLKRGFDVVSADLVSMGYRIAWGIVRASEAGAPHPRARLYVVAVDANTTSFLGNTEGSSNTEHDPANPRGESMPLGIHSEHVEWGRYGESVDAWGRILGRPAPKPVDDDGLTSPEFNEWIMGIPKGWVTQTPGITRAEMLKLTGNGVVPQQAELAIRELLRRLA